MSAVPAKGVEVGRLVVSVLILTTTFLLALLFDRRDSIAYTMGLAAAQLGASALLSIIPLLCWRFLTSSGKASSMSFALNVMCGLVAIVWFLCFVVLNSILSNYIPTLAINSDSDIQKAAQVQPPLSKPVAGNASSVTESFTVTTWNTPSCGDWLEHRAQGDASRVQTWLAAYLSGYAKSARANFLVKTNRVSAYHRVDVFCRLNPLNDAEDGALDLINELQSSGR